MKHGARIGNENLVCHPYSSARQEPFRHGAASRALWLGHLEDASELGVPVRDMPFAFAVCQGADHISQCQQALVDVDALTQLLPGGSCVVCSFTSCTTPLP